MTKYALWLSAVSLVLLSSGCATPEPPIVNDRKLVGKEYVMKVTATAYTSTVGQTDSTPFLAAWNNKLKPGVKSLAVSRDLLALGLTNGTKVRIDGYKHNYTILDKMNKRWKNKIDIYMGRNTPRALRWGKQTVTIRWAATKEDIAREKELAKKALAQKEKSIKILDYIFKS